MVSEPDGRVALEFHIYFDREKEKRPVLFRNVGIGATVVSVFDSSVAPSSGGVEGTITEICDCYTIRDVHVTRSVLPLLTAPFLGWGAEKVHTVVFGDGMGVVFYRNMTGDVISGAGVGVNRKDYCDGTKIQERESIEASCYNVELGTGAWSAITEQGVVLLTYKRDAGWFNVMSRVSEDLRGQRQLEAGAGGRFGDSNYTAMVLESELPELSRDYILKYLNTMTWVKPIEISPTRAVSRLSE